MPVTRHPPHRPVLALLTHTVLTSDIWRQTAHSATGVEPRPGESGTKSLQKTSPRPSALLAPPAYLAEPQTKHLTTEPLHSLLVVRYGVILEISANHRLEPLQVLLDRFVHPFSQFLPNILQ